MNGSAAALPAGGKKNATRAGDVRAYLRLQRLDLMFE